VAELVGHRSAERRSIAYHRCVADKIQRQPELLNRARERLSRLSSHYAALWNARLEGPLGDLVEFMVSDSPEARDCRQSSPFVGLLTARERWIIWKAVR
jgi:hypothetical protein